MDMAIDGDGISCVRLHLLRGAKKSERWMGGRSSNNQVEGVVVRLKCKYLTNGWCMAVWIV